MSAEPSPAAPTCTSPSTPPAAPMTGAMISPRSTATGMKLPNGPRCLPRATPRAPPPGVPRPLPIRRRGRLRPPPGRTRPHLPHRRPSHRPAVRRRTRPRGAGRPRRRAPPRRRRRRRHLRRHPQHQLHQRLLHRLPVLRVRATPDRRRRVHPVAAADRRPRRRSLGRRCHRGVHAGRHPSRSARDSILRNRFRSQAATPRSSRTRVLTHGGRERRLPHRPAD